MMGFVVHVYYFYLKCTTGLQTYIKNLLRREKGNKGLH